MNSAWKHLWTPLCGALLVTACESKQQTAYPAREPVVVYAYGSDASGLAAWLDEFSDSSGIPVTVRYGDSATITDNVISNRGSPTADVLLTSNVADIWRAADEGALRPLQAESLQDVPAALRDPDAQWAAVGVRSAVIGVSGRIPAPSADSYRALAGEDLRGQLCLSSAKLPVNRALIAMLIEDLGVRPAETLVRGWIRNLALPPFDTEEELVAALRSGSCSYGIVSSSLVDAGIGHIEPAPLYIDIDAVGVARHARYPDSAQVLVDWMLDQKAPVQPVSSSDRNIGLAGWRDEDALLLAERAGYR